VQQNKFEAVFACTQKNNNGEIHIPAPKWKWNKATVNLCVLYLTKMLLPLESSIYLK